MNGFEILAWWTMIGTAIAFYSLTTPKQRDEWTQLFLAFLLVATSVLTIVDLLSAW